MDSKTTIESWSWRIKKTKLKQAEFAALAGFSGSELSQYINGHIQPSLTRFELIEKKLKELGV